MSLAKPSPGDAGRTQRYGRAVRHQDFEEGHHHSGRRHRVHAGGKARPGPAEQAAFFGPTPFLLPDHGSALLCHGIRQRWRSHVPDTTMRQIQGTGGRVS